MFVKGRYVSVDVPFTDLLHEFIHSDIVWADTKEIAIRFMQIFQGCVSDNGAQFGNNF